MSHQIEANSLSKIFWEMTKILIADSLAPNVVKRLEEEGCKVRMDPSISEKSLPNEINDYDILVVRSTKVTRLAIESAKSLKLIIRAGAGVNTIDINAASEKGIYVTNTPGCNSDAVAELTIGHLIACDRQIVQNSINLRNGEWKKENYLNCCGLKGRTLGLLGAGNVAQRVIKIAHAIGMEVIVWSYFFDENDAARLGVTRVLDKMDVARNSDAISIHIPYTSETHHLISKEFFDAMKPGAIIVNTARGEIIDTKALAEAIKEKGIKAGLDVYENEPASSSSSFDQSDFAQIISSSTCHIGGSTKQASELIANETINVVMTYIKTGKVLNCVNIENDPNCDSILSIRHKGALSQIIQFITKNNAQILSMNNELLKGGEGQICTIKIKGNCDNKDITSIDGVIGFDVLPAMNF